MQHLRNMHWFTRLLMPKSHNEQPCSECEQLAARLHRLEIAFNEQRERLDGLEGRHASLSASVRGRLGGRPKASQTVYNDPPLPFARP